MTIDTFFIAENASLRDTLLAIDRGAAGVALMIDRENRLLGVITDGDVRRGILSGAELTAPARQYMKDSFRHVSTSVNRNEAMDLMKAFSIEHLPILDEARRVVGLHLLNDLVKPDVLPNAAMILAGGKGTRLGQLTSRTPKPMITVAGRPILERLILHLVGGGIRRVFISVNYLSDVIEQHFGDGSAFGCRIEYLHEREPLGTGGPLALLKDRSLSDPFLVLNGDLVTDFSVSRIFNTHIENQNRITLGIRTYSHDVPFGCITLNGNEVVELNEKPTLVQKINAGIYVFDADLIRELRPEFQPITAIVETVLKSSGKIGSYEIDEWIDIGEPDQLALAQGK